MSEFDLLVLGDCNPDLVIRGGDVEPAFGQTERVVDEARLVIGGSSAILACGAARLGLRTALVGVVGSDPFGRFMIETIAGRGVDVRGVVVDPSAPTGLTVVLSRNDDRASLTALGAIRALRADLIDRDLLRSAPHVHVGGYYLQPGLRTDLPDVFDEVHRAGATTSLDPGWDPAGAWDGGLRRTLERTDCFLPNAAEARSVAGAVRVEDAAQTLAGLVPLVVVKRGGDGGLARQGDVVVEAPALPIEPVDTTGAGDSFGAGFLAGHLLGWSLERALALACACGSLSTRAPGGTQAQPTMDEALGALAAAGAAGPAR